MQNVERRWHCSYHINNKLILHGGWNSFGALNSLVSLDLGTLCRRVCHEVVCRVCVACALTGVVNRTDTMKWDTLAWENGPSPRRWHTLSPMPGHPERLFSYGGYDAPKHPLNDSFILDLGTAHRQFKPRHQHSHVCPVRRVRWCVCVSCGEH